MRREVARVITSYDKGNPPWGSDDELRADLSSPAALTPAQYYPAPAASPYHHLLLAIVEDAIRCFQRNFAVRNGPGRGLFQETEEWLFDSDGTAFLSCPTICENLGINPVQLRRYLREWRLRMKGHQAPRLVRRRSVPDDPYNLTGCLSHDTRAADSSSTSRGIALTSGPVAKPSDSDMRLM
jgi:hypothetical protein